MRISHRVCINADVAQLEDLKRHGVEYEDLGNRLIVFVIFEDHPNWRAIASLISKWKAPDLPSTEFSERELEQAQSLRLGPDWHHGYPEPEDGFERITYVGSKFCEHCGMETVQQAPFRMSREPKWGRRQILQLNWIMDEYFVTPEAWKQVFRPFGIDCLPVMHHKNGRPLETVVQLQITAWTATKVNPEGYVPEYCAVCKHMKLSQGLPGRFPYVKMPPGAQMAKTPEYFGSGGAAWHEVIISAALYRAIASHKLRGACFDVVAAPGQPRVD